MLEILAANSKLMPSCRALDFEKSCEDIFESRRRAKRRRDDYQLTSDKTEFVRKEWDKALRDHLGPVSIALPDF